MTITENIKNIKNEICSLSEKHGRDPQSIHLVAVSKKQPEERIEEALAAGHRLFGENRVQEAQQHWAERRTYYPDLKLHLIGPLQTNKVKEAVALFDVIETVDREKLARKLSDEIEKQKRDLSCFIQVNTGEEEQKAGIDPAALPDFLSYCQKECNLNVSGLMCIPPMDEPPALHFALLNKLAEQHGLKQLSMGMSADYDRAIPLGATYVRVGSAIFGARQE